MKDTTTAVRVLVVDDEENIRTVLRRYLETEGIAVAEAADGDQALARLHEAATDVVLLDIMLPGTDGLEVLRRLRATSDAFVILISARTEEVDRLVGLGMGADDYITKPFSPREVVARVKAMLRRGRATADERPLTFQGLTVDTAGRVASVDGSEVALSSLEFDLLAALAASPGRVFSRQQLLERVWGYDFFGDERVVDVHVRNLRAKLGDDASAPRFLSTVRGAGYKFVGTPT
jgi:DNA-binding response OmpR family regulator